ncbi:short transient receptor potential channel 6-like [Asterias rubens]|uniref:short transient receptor potential channel 6-like n=1 Tax=Asterias rubens TaxID=7604 RepID=UPI001455AACE|nr:short transient receptor potential channel 6-like [Asterias rubens]
MENEAYEMDGFENGHRTNGNLAHDEANQNGFHLNGKSRDYDGEGGALVSNGKPLPHAEESRRYDVVKDLAQTGNGPKLDALLAEWEDLGWLRDWRNEDGLTLYADAITDGYIDVINTLISYDLPMGDALIRAIEADFGDAVVAMCRCLRRRKDLRKSILNGKCDNDDFHPAITPLLLAAQRNNFDAVQLLVELGATIIEPSLCLGDDVTLTQATSALQIYRGLSRPAYILNTQTDVFGHAFEMSARLRTLSVMWEDFGAEYEEMAKSVDVFAGEMLGQSSSTEEILALFRYHTTDKYRDSRGVQHPLSKMFEAIKYQQKEFIAHPHSQKAIIAQFYQNLLSWNEKGVIHQILLTLFVLLGYPIISLLYIFFPFSKVVNFARLPYVMMLMKAGSGFTFLAMLIVDSVLDKYDYPTTITVIRWLIVVWILGLMWLHMKVCMKKGVTKYLSDFANLHEMAIIALFLAIFVLQWNGRILFGENFIFTRSKRQAVHNPAVHNPAVNNPYAELRDQVALTLNGLREKLNETVVVGVNRAVMGVLSGCGPLITSTNAPIPPLPPKLQDAYDLDPYDPEVVAEALFGIAIMVSFLRLLNLLLVSDVFGPLRISLGAMTNDFLKFFGVFIIIWFSFAVGLHQTFYSAGVATNRQCLSEGGDPDVCSELTGFSSVFVSLYNLYWTLFGKIGLDILVIPGHHAVAEIVATLLFLCYHIVAVLILLNALIGMLSNTYNSIEEQADTEWKFHRAAVWANYMQPVGTLPPPFNLIPSLKTMYRKFIMIYSMGKSGRENEKELHSKKELEDYTRVLKLTCSRYVQENLSASALNSEGLRPRDLQTMRNEVKSFRFATESRLQQIAGSLSVSNKKSLDLSKKLEDLIPLEDHTKEVLRKLDEVILFTSDLGTGAVDVDGEQNSVILMKDTMIADLTAQLSALRTENEEMVVAHSAQNLEHERRQASLGDTINILQGQRSNMMINLGGLSEDKERLEADVEKLNQEVMRLQTMIPVPNEEAPTPEPTPEPTPVRLGFVARVKKGIEVVLNSEADSSNKTKEEQVLSGINERGASPDSDAVAMQGASQPPSQVDQEQVKDLDELEAKPDPDDDQREAAAGDTDQPQIGIFKRITSKIEVTLAPKKEQKDPSAKTPMQEPGADVELPKEQPEQSLSQEEVPGSCLESGGDQQSITPDGQLETNDRSGGKLPSVEQEETPEQQQGTEPERQGPEPEQSDEVEV